MNLFVLLIGFVAAFVLLGLTFVAFTLLFALLKWCGIPQWEAYWLSMLIVNGLCSHWVYKVLIEKD